MKPWSDRNRFSQGGYSAITIFPSEKNYINKKLYAEDLAKANERQITHLEWMEEQYIEGRLEYLEQKAEIKSQREDWDEY